MFQQAKLLLVGVIAALISASTAVSQTASTAGHVVINANDNIDKLVEAYTNENIRKKGCEGYRVQILSESGNDAKKKASDSKTAFLTQYPTYPAYLLFQTPNFKIRVGDFRTKLEAYRCMKEIHGGFPNAFVVKDDIQFPPLE